MRPFGHAVDLDLDFGLQDRPALVTALLASCGESGDAAFWWSEPVGVRIAALLQLVVVNERRAEISLSRRCSAVGCGEAFGFTLPLLALAAATTSASPLQIHLDA